MGRRRRQGAGAERMRGGAADGGNRNGGDTRTPGSDEPEKATTARRSLADAGREWLRTLLIAGALFLFIQFFLLKTFVVTSGSMEDTLLVRDHLVGNRLAVGPRIPGTKTRLPGYAPPRRGDVLVFDPHHEADSRLVKRLLGLPGDTLAMTGGVLVVNGVRQREPYLKRSQGTPDGHDPTMMWQREHLVASADRKGYLPTRDNWGPLVVPDGHYFMLGDNRESSLDSRYWGPLETWRVEARVFVVYYSWDETALAPLPWLAAARWGRIGRRVDGRPVGDPGQ